MIVGDDPFVRGRVIDARADVAALLSDLLARVVGLTQSGSAENDLIANTWRDAWMRAANATASLANFRISALT